MVGQPAGGEALGKPLSVAALKGGIDRLKGSGFQVDMTGSLVRITRGALEGTRDWTHEFAGANNTFCSEDPTVKDPFGVLWFGSPGSRNVIDRHSGGPTPLVVDGVIFIEGNDVVMAYDIYNGLPLWERVLPKSPARASRASPATWPPTRRPCTSWRPTRSATSSTRSRARRSRRTRCRRRRGQRVRAGVGSPPTPGCSMAAAASSMTATA